MSSSSTSAPSSAPGECVVCGEEASMKCSVCNKAGLDWMYFCSSEHQSSIWKTHKRVCGKIPFEWPLLNEAEEEEIFKRRNEFCRKFDSKTMIEITAADEPAGVARDEHFRRMLETVSKRRRSDRISALQKEQFDEFLLVVRHLWFQLKLNEIEATSGPWWPHKECCRLVETSPFDLVAWYYVAMGPYGRKCPSEVTKGQQSRLKHRLMILVGKLGADIRSRQEQPHVAEDDTRSLLHVARACTAVDPESNFSELKDGHFDKIVIELLRFGGRELKRT